MKSNAIKQASILSLILSITSCCGIDIQELEVMENPFRNQIEVKVDSAKGIDTHEIFQEFNNDINHLYQYNDNLSKLELSYNVLNEDKKMDTAYGYIMYIPTYASLGTFCLTGWPIDFMTQTVSIKGDLYDKNNNFVKRYTGEGFSYKTVACYYGYSATNARKLANSLAFNEALEEIYEQMEEDFEEMKEKMLSEDNYDEIISNLVENFTENENIQDEEEIILSISETLADSSLVEKELFEKKLRTALIQTNKVKFASYTEDEAIMDTRQLRKSEEVNQDTVAKKNSLLAPEIALKIEIIAREDDDQNEYFFYLTFTDIETGIVTIELEESFKK